MAFAQIVDTTEHWPEWPQIRTHSALNLCGQISLVKIETNIIISKVT